MTKVKTILDGNDVMRRNHLNRLAQGSQGIAHLVPNEDGKADERGKFIDEVAEIGRKNRVAATRATKRKTWAGSKT